jgi:hypothetical protein
VEKHDGGEFRLDPVHWSARYGFAVTFKGDTPMDNPTARNKEVRDRAKKLEAQGHMFDMCWPEFIAYCHEVGWRADRIDAG